MRGVAAVKPGNTTGHIGAAIQSFAERERCGVVRDFCGHGLGRVFHDRPNILHYGEPGDGVMLEPGMLFTIEPMINLGKPHVKILPDGWTAVTRDRELSAQFEHTVGVTERAARCSRCRRKACTGRRINSPHKGPGDGWGAQGPRRQPPSHRGRRRASCRSIEPRPAACRTSQPPEAALHQQPGRDARTTSCSSCCCSAPFPAAIPSRSPSCCWRASARSPRSSTRRPSG